jgi:hypothetical protein
VQVRRNSRMEALASSPRFAIPFCTASVGAIRIRTNTGFRVSGKARARARLVLCCAGDGNGHGEDEAASASEATRLRRENSELRASLAELSQSLASISAALADVSRAVQLVANAVDCGPSPNGVLGSPTATTPPSPDPAQATPQLPAIQDPVQAQLMEQNMKAHNVAYKLQQAFFQARIEGLGKPFEVSRTSPFLFSPLAHAIRNLHM